MNENDIIPIIPRYLRREATELEKQLLLRWLEESEENRRFFGTGYHESEYVFKWQDGTPFRPDFVTRHFKMLLEKNGLPTIRFHELRHSCASMLLNEGFSLKDIQAYMGARGYHDDRRSLWTSGCGQKRNAFKESCE